jgi:hypothetical protein
MNEEWLATAYWTVACGESLNIAKFISIVF